MQKKEVRGRGEEMTGAIKRKARHGNRVSMAGLGFVLLGLAGLLVFQAMDRALPDEFSYNAKIFSVDNFFDKSKGDFLGEEISRTRFSYDIAEDKGDILIIRNLFDVRRLTGEPIIAVERLYGVDKRTGKHVQGYGDRDREGFLFAPKGLKKGESFVYWHINYDEPAVMKFREVKHLDGLEVYWYEADYHADQTADLEHLPGVPEKQGVELDINLQLWVEPVTGRMIKYEDNTIAYFYDMKTGERIHPWNRFNNKYQDVSVNKQKEIALREKNRITLTRFAFLTIMTLGVLLTWAGHVRQKKTSETGKKPERKSGKRLWPLKNIALLFSVAALVLVSAFFSSVFSDGNDQTRIAIIKWNDNQEFNTLITGFKERLAEEGFVEGVNVRYLEGFSATDRKTHVEIARDFVEQDVDLIFSITTPGTLIVKSVTEEIPVVFSIVTHPVETGVVENLENSGNNLVGTRNYVPASRQLELLESVYPQIQVLGFAHRTGEANSEIQLREFTNVLEKRGKRVIELNGHDVPSLVEKVAENLKEVDVVFLACDTLISFGGDKAIIKLNKEGGYDKPVFACNPDGVINGALMGNVAEWKALGDISGKKAAFILRGAEPSWLRTEAPSGDYIMINMAAVEEAGIQVPKDIHKRAKEVLR